MEVSPGSEKEEESSATTSGGAAGARKTAEKEREGPACARNERKTEEKIEAKDGGEEERGLGPKEEGLEPTRRRWEREGKAERMAAG